MDKAKMDRPLHYICVFCGSSASPDPVFTHAASWVGELIAQHGLALVYGAGCTGMMGEVARGVLAKGGEVIGITHKLEAMHASSLEGLTRLEVLETLPQRKARMNELADAFIILPGGYGTLDEMAEVLAWTQIGLQSKPIGILNVKGYYDGLLTWIRRAAAEQYIHAEDLHSFVVDEDPERLLTTLLQQ
jgi:uncharacterized protein (TIGR00730 family)